ncbi:hypothetical protein LTR08_000510 [Meristemomyces frigidus]|nr:hypothetical protein LTR08_000510 [Meristemomyces frigidus]
MQITISLAAFLALFASSPVLGYMVDLKVELHRFHSADCKGKYAGVRHKLHYHHPPGTHVCRHFDWPIPFQSIRYQYAGKRDLNQVPGLNGEEGTCTIGMHPDKHCKKNGTDGSVDVLAGLNVCQTNGGFHAHSVSIRCDRTPEPDNEDV